MRILCVEGVRSPDLTDSRASATAAAQLRLANNLPVSIGEFCLGYGIPYSYGRRVWNEAGFPSICGRVFPRAFETWSAQPRGQQTGAGLPPHDAGKVGGLDARSGLRVSWKQIAAPQPFGVRSLA